MTKYWHHWYKETELKIRLVKLDKQENEKVFVHGSEVFTENSRKEFTLLGTHLKFSTEKEITTDRTKDRSHDG